ncbi:MAG: V-type ATP synthase subunit A [DPANN group archaeon]|nr:V-type ATP synthase subunit A [DPANN group archaeon]
MSGKIKRIVGQTIEAKDMRGCRMLDQVTIGEIGLIGEIIKIHEDVAYIQTFEDTTGLKIGDIVETKNEPLTAELGPGLIGSIFDGIQRPLNKIGNFIERGERPNALNNNQKWTIKKIKEGQTKTGEIIATLNETSLIEYRILAPKDGIVEINEGEYTLDETFGKLITNDGNTEELTLRKRIPINHRTKIKKLVPTELLITGQRVLDTLFPLTKGGSAALPGGFGAGKTITTQEIAKWADVDIIVMALIGERGNECADVLNTFPKIKDIKTQKSIMEKSIIIANTSNMPVAARISSIYLATTICEHYRNMGYNILLITDSTSRWAEAMREISGKLEEMPGEEGYPVYLASKIAEFYEKAGVIETQFNTTGSITIIGAVSPPGGDFSEPVTQATKNVIKCLWALNTELAYRRHYPSVDWMVSYSNYNENLNMDLKFKGWNRLRNKIVNLLQDEKEIETVVRLVGYDSLPNNEKFLLEVTKLFRENFLQQDAFSKVDAFCPLKKQYEMLKIFINYYEAGIIAMKHEKDIEYVLNPNIVDKIARMKFEEQNEFPEINNLIKNTLFEEETKIEWLGN